MPQGTIVDCNDFDDQQDCEILRSAMNRIGTDEAKLIGVVTHRSNEQRQKILASYAQMFGRQLIDDLKSELSGKLENVMVALFKLPDVYDATCLYEAMKGIGTTESTLIEIMCSRSNAQIKAIVDAYKKLYGSKLAEDLQSETSGSLKRLLYSLAQGARHEDEECDSQKAEEDAHALLNAGEGTWGTDESRFNVIMASRSFTQLAHTFRKYEAISKKKSLEDAIKSEFSGDIEDGLIAIVKCAKDLPTYFAERLYKSIQGLGTNDAALIRIMVSRSEIDMVQIKQVFQSKYGKSLEEYIKGDTSGDYREALIQLCRGNPQ